MGRKETVLVRITPDMKDKMLRFCGKHDITISHLVRRAIYRELETDNK